MKHHFETFRHKIIRAYLGLPRKLQVMSSCVSQNKIPEDWVSKRNTEDNPAHLQFWPQNFGIIHNQITHYPEAPPGLIPKKPFEAVSDGVSDGDTLDRQIIGWTNSECYRCFTPLVVQWIRNIHGRFMDILMMLDDICWYQLQKFGCNRGSDVGFPGVPKWFRVVISACPKLQLVGFFV